MQGEHTSRRNAVSSLGWTRRAAFVVALLTPGCESGPAEPPPEFPFALATRECGPADGPAVAIYLVRDTMPALPPGGARVRVYVWHALDELPGRSWAVGGDSPDGFAEYWDGAGETTPLRGTVTVAAVRADSTVEGEVDLVSGGAFAVRGGFRAAWRPRVLMCG
jgi:hypothetical protein